jgi:hypothetical protein
MFGKWLIGSMNPERNRRIAGESCPPATPRECHVPLIRLNAGGLYGQGKTG